VSYYCPYCGGAATDSTCVFCKAGPVDAFRARQIIDECEDARCGSCKKITQSLGVSRVCTRCWDTYVRTSDFLVRTGRVKS